MANEFAIHPETTLLVHEIRVIGGKHVERELISDEIEGRKRATEAKITVTIENTEERAMAETLRARIHGIIRRYTSNTIIGQLCPRQRVAEVKREIEERAMADVRAFNLEATTCRIDVNLLPIEISIALGPEAVRHIADHVRRKLEDIRDTLRSGDAKGAQSKLIDIKRLHELATGVQSESIHFAIEEATNRVIELKRAIKGSKSGSESPESAGRSLNLEMIESAIGMFTYGATLPEYDISAALA